jgi:hypothetical protein
VKRWATAVYTTSLRSLSLVAFSCHSHSRPYYQRNDDAPSHLPQVVIANKHLFTAADMAARTPTEFSRPGDLLLVVRKCTCAPCRPLLFLLGCIMAVTRHWRGEIVS